jgi:ABC-type uncharacterized transport system permease subunit
MPQGPFQTTSLGNATSSSLNVAAATVVKPTPGFVATVSVVVAGTAAGAIYDSTSSAGNTVANQIAAIPDVVGVYSINFPAKTGIVVAPGAGQTVTISYN